MDKLLEKALKSFEYQYHNVNNGSTIGHIINEYDKEMLDKYGKYSNKEFISLLRIERLFELGYITDLEKEKLTCVFNNYIKTKNEYNEKILNNYSILEDIDYKSAVINEIDRNIKIKIKKR